MYSIVGPPSVTSTQFNLTFPYNILVLVGPSGEEYGHEGVGISGNTAVVASGVRSDGVDVPKLFLADTLAIAFPPSSH